MLPAATSDAMRGLRRTASQAAVTGPPDTETQAPADIDSLLLSLAAELPASKAAAEAAKMTGTSKQDLYRRLLELKANA